MKYLIFSILLCAFFPFTLSNKHYNKEVVIVIEEEEVEFDPFSFEYREFLNTLELRNHLPYDLLFTMMMMESSGRPEVISSAGAQGLFQFMPTTAEWLEIDPFDPYEAAEGAATYMRHLLDKHNQDIHLALAAYNAGTSKVHKYKGVPPYKETQKYVLTITNQILL